MRIRISRSSSQLGNSRISAELTPQAYSVTARPGLLIVPGGQYQVMISTTSRPAWTRNRVPGRSHQGPFGKGKNPRRT
jgi:hypothetical protein